jgi:hypothetical protein
VAGNDGAEAVYLLKIGKRSVFHAGCERIAYDHQLLELDRAPELRLRHSGSKVKNKGNRKFTSPGNSGFQEQLPPGFELYPESDEHRWARKGS